MVVSMSTLDLPKGDQQDFWQGALNEMYFGLESRQARPEKSGEYRGSLQRVQIGGLSVDAVCAQGHEVHRTRQQVAKSPTDDVLLCALRAGTGIVLQGDRCAVLDRAGDFVLIDAARPYVFRLDGDFEQLVVRIDRRDINALLPDLGQITARTAGRGTGLGCLAAGLLLSLPTDGNDFTDAGGYRMGEHLLTLVADTFAERFGREMGELSSGALLVERAKHYVQASLADPNLSPRDVAEAIAVSERYLFSLFRDVGTTPSAYIKERRLEVAHQELSDPRHAHRSIEQIALRVGFKQLSHFSRSYRSRYGATPRSARLAA